MYMRYSIVREITDPLQHEITDTASAWGPRSTSLLLADFTTHGQKCFLGL